METEMWCGYPVIRDIEVLSGETDKFRGKRVIVARYSDYEVENFALKTGVRIRCLGHVNIEETREGGTLVEVFGAYTYRPPTPFRNR